MEEYRFIKRKISEVFQRYYLPIHNNKTITESPKLSHTNSWSKLHNIQKHENIPEQSSDSNKYTTKKVEPKIVTRKSLPENWSIENKSFPKFINQNNNPDN